MSDKLRCSHGIFFSLDVNYFTLKVFNIKEKWLFEVSLIFGYLFYST